MFFEKKQALSTHTDLPPLFSPSNRQKNDSTAIYTNASLDMIVQWLSYALSLSSGHLALHLHRTQGLSAHMACAQPSNASHCTATDDATCCSPCSLPQWKLPFKCMAAEHRWSNLVKPSAASAQFAGKDLLKRINTRTVTRTMHVVPRSGKIYTPISIPTLNPP